MVRFICAGYGSFINISWSFNEVCGNRTCNHDAALVRKHVSGEERGRQVTSTLMINTSLLHLDLTGGVYSATVGCVIHQTVPLEYNLHGRDIQVLTGLAITGTHIEIKPEVHGAIGYLHKFN
jgi:hypothetical protein